MLKKLLSSQSFRTGAITAVLILGLILLYYHPLLQGKRIASHDVVSNAGMAQDILNYRNTHNGQDPVWSRSAFSGMPAYMIHFHYEGNVLLPVFRGIANTLPSPIGFLFIGMLTFFLLLRQWKIEQWLALAGAIGFGFFTYNGIIFEAGHNNKLFTIMFIPAVLYGVTLAFGGKLLLGAALTFLFVGLQIHAGHYQIIYYFVFVLAGYIAVLAYNQYTEQPPQQRTFKPTLITGGVLLIIAGLSATINFTKMLPVMEYTKYSIRGPSELKPTTERNLLKNKSIAEDAEKTGALDKDYAYAWSNDRDELLTLLIPNLKGGASNSALTKSSEVYKQFRDQIGEDGIKRKQFPTYWGTQAFTSGAPYIGAIICFLFVLGLFLVDGAIKWMLLYTTLIFAMLSLGKNSLPVIQAFFVLALPLVYIFSHKYVKGISKVAYGTILAATGLLVTVFLGGDHSNAYTIKDLVFDYLPVYNKFRAPASMLFMVCVSMPWLAVLGANALLNPDLSQERKKMALFYAAGITLGVCLVFGLAPGLVYNRFASPNDSTKPDMKPFFDALADDRKSMLVSDAWRSFFLIALAAGLCWAWITQTLKNAIIMTGGIALMLFVDLFLVNMRTLWREDYVSKQQFENAQVSDFEVDNFLKKELDKGQYFRVFAPERNPFNDSKTPSKLFSIGGYNAAKVKRYQQLIEAHISQGSMNVLNMLNTGYFIYNTRPNQPVVGAVFVSKRDNEVVIKNEMAYGPAWITPKVLVVRTPDEALDTLDGVNSMQTAVVEQKQAALIQGLNTDSVKIGQEKVVLEKNDNRLMRYKVTVSGKRFVTFSEVYYSGESTTSKAIAPGVENPSIGWRAFIDGQETEIIQTNFVLRGLVVPDGTHTVEFRYNPDILTLAYPWSMVSSVVLVLLLMGAVGFEVYRNVKQPAVASN